MLNSFSSIDRMFPLELLQPSLRFLLSLVADQSHQNRDFKEVFHRFIVLQAGRHNKTWEAAGQSSGVSLYKLITDDAVKAGRMILLK